MGATVFVQPLDLVKNRMQLSGQGGKAREYKTSFHALASILKNEGLGGIYTGLSAGLLRQATYTTTRLGIYTVLFEKMTGQDGTPPNFLMKALIGMTAGATGAFVGTPAEVALIRMTADGRLPADQKRGYSNVFNALARITKEEGVTTLWRVRYYYYTAISILLINILHYNNANKYTITTNKYTITTLLINILYY
uniref:Solute carrier family 25 member 11 n=1 Tax=Hucho hucho TaxID=62062 RepID=A0A4W5JEZ8_9TELE